MKSTKHTIVVGLMAITFLGGCAGKETEDAAVKARVAGTVTDDATRTKVEGVAVGAAGGAATRIVAQVVPGGKKIRRIARYGSAIGGAGGYLLGSSIAQRKKNYINEEDRLNGEIKIFHQLNEKIFNYNTATANEITILQDKLSEIELKKKATQEQIAFSVKAKESFAKKAALDKATTARLAAELSDLNAYFQSIEGTGDPSRVAALRQEIEALQKHATQFESNNQQMARLVAAMPVRN